VNNRLIEQQDEDSGIKKKNFNLNDDNKKCTKYWAQYKASGIIFNHIHT